MPCPAHTHNAGISGKYNAGLGIVNVVWQINPRVCGGGPWSVTLTEEDVFGDCAGDVKIDLCVVFTVLLTELLRAINGCGVKGEGGGVT